MCSFYCNIAFLVFFCSFSDLIVFWLILDDSGCQLLNAIIQRMLTMCPLESVRPSNGKVPLKLIEKRLKHLRRELRNFTKRELACATSNLLMEQTGNDQEEHHVQYNMRLNQLSRLYDKQVNNLNLWHFYRSHSIEQMHRHELRHFEQTFQMKKADFKSKLLITLTDKRHYLDFEHQNVNIRCRYLPSDDQYLLNRMNETSDGMPFDGHPRLPSESIQQQQQSPRPTYFLRRAAVPDVVSETLSTTSLKDLSIFSRSNSLLPPFGGIELQCCLPNTDIDEDVMDIQRGLSRIASRTEKAPSTHRIDDALIKPPIDVWIEEGRLWYQRAWFSRNSPILLVFDDMETVPALVLSVGRNDLLIRRSGTNIKHRVSLSLLHDGYLAIRKRNCNL